MILLLMLVLPVSALAARRMPSATVVKYAAAWLAIFGIGFLMLRYFTYINTTSCLVV